MTEPEAAPRRNLFAHWRRWLPRATFESVLIVFSVVLALALTNWAEDRRTAHRVAEMRGFLRAEIQANRDMLSGEDYLPHHVALKQGFAAVMGAPGDPVRSGKARPAVEALFRTGLHQAPVRDTVWTSVASGDLLEHMPPREVFMLAELYRAQDSLEGLNRGGFEAATGLLDVLAGDADVTRPVYTMMLYLEDMAAQERALIAAYDRVLAHMDAERVTPAVLFTPPAATRKDDGAAPTG